MSSKAPFVRQVSWPLVIPQVIAGIVSIGLVHAVLRPEGFRHSIMLGCAIYLVYSIGSRRLIASAHRNGIRLTKQGKLQEAIQQYERSYQFFIRHKWIDQLRSVVLMNPSAISYREMALVNIAFCHGQLGNAESAKECFNKTLQEFPDSVVAKASLRMIETFEESEKPEPTPDPSR